MDTVLEIASPLREGQILEVRRDLNQLERIDEVRKSEPRPRHFSDSHRDPVYVAANARFKSAAAVRFDRAPPPLNLTSALLLL